VDEPTRVRSPVRGRPRPSARQVVVRRIVALAALLAAIGGAAWLATVAIRGVSGGESAPPPASTTAAPAPDPLRIVFPEGYTRREMAARIAAVRKIAQQKRKVNPQIRQAQYLRLTERSKLPGEFAGDGKVRNLEGFLFPATYEFLPQTTSRQLVEKQLTAFRRAWRQVDLADAKQKNLTAYDVLIIASMVEKETIAPDERKLVAAVIYNRLKAGMPLGIDATIRYGLDVPGTEPLRRSHLDSDNPYNTRKRAGLTPTPIANPGLASMQAAAHPAAVNYLFFVRKPDKVHHFFTASESEFYAKACEYGYGCG
jgi:UPF0755 protein